MIDIKVLQTMLKRANIEHTIEVDEEVLTVILIPCETGYCVSIMFNDDGSLHSIEAYEQQ